MASKVVVEEVVEVVLDLYVGDGMIQWVKTH